jgi:hypothetical protein
MRELMVMDRFFGGLKSNHRERMSFKELKSLKHFVKGNCAAMLNEVKLEKMKNLLMLNLPTPILKLSLKQKKRSGG